MPGTVGGYCFKRDLRSRGTPERRRTQRLVKRLERACATPHTRAFRLGALIAACCVGLIDLLCLACAKYHKLVSGASARAEPWQKAQVSLLDLISKSLLLNK